MDDYVTVGGYNFCEWKQTTNGNTRTWCDTVGCYVDICPDGRVFVFDEFGESFEPPLGEEQKVIEAAKSARWKREMAELEVVDA